MSPSSTIGHYRIVSKLGEGGMGAVYRATDTKLNREVAIKVLSDALANDPDYLERFTREAQVLASLNHPNIATIYGVEDRAIVMELVEGRDLPTPLPLDEAIPIARQIAEALEAAHEKGIVHRDLKPANIKLTPAGVVKVLDFGLAKAADPIAPASGVNSPTLTLRATQVGVILGTAAYMSPEQAAGKVVDKRADVWAFGVVLYELLTGKMLFSGETISHTLASVLKDPISLDVVPDPLRPLLARCLERNPKDRLRDIGEARVFLSQPLAAPAPAAPPARSRRLPWTVAAALLVALAGTVAWTLRPSPPAPVTRFRYTLPASQLFTYASRSVIAISPDGQQMAYVANRQIYLRKMSEADGRPVPGTEVATTPTDPVFSPDGKWIAYFDDAARSIKRVLLTGGMPLSVCETPIPYGIQWVSEGIVFDAPGKGILKIQPNGGAPELLVRVKPGEWMADAQLLPGGRDLVFSWARTDSATDVPQWALASIDVQNLATGARRTLVQHASAPRYVPTGHLVYQTGGVLMAAPFNLRQTELTGGATPVIEGVSQLSGGAQVVFSANGTLVYLPGPISDGSGNDALALTDAAGEIQPLRMPPGTYRYPRVSRDGKRVAFQSDEGNESSIWIWELGGETSPRRLTLPGTGANRFPAWSADGERVAFQSGRGGTPAIWWQRADGNSPAERLTTPEKDTAHVPDSLSPDGQTLLYTIQKSDVWEIWTLSLRDRKPALFAAAPGAKLGRGVFSPDGRWVGYQSAAQPKSHLYVRPFPSTGAEYLAPADADSHHPVWSPDGKALYYVAGPYMSGYFTFQNKPAVAFGKPVRLPRTGFQTAVPVSARTYDVMPDGKHFLGISSRTAGGTQDASTIHVVLNWFEELKQRVAAN